MRVYLDCNASMPVKPAVRESMVEALAGMGNASSTHAEGRAVRRQIDAARAALAALVAARPAEVIFTSGGTEANNLMLHSFDSVVTSALEHASVLAFAPLDRRIPATPEGVVDLDAAEKRIRALPVPSCVSVMLVNNETGVIQPTQEIGALAHRYGHIFHVDASQAIGRIPVDFQKLQADALTLSGHKMGGPQGIGALIVRDSVPLRPLLKGGGQERNRRAGSENLPAIVGFGVAATLAPQDLDQAPRLGRLRDSLQQALLEGGGADVRIAGEKAPRTSSTLCVGLRGVKGETQVASMDLSGVAVSAGSACSSGKAKPSIVLQAMGWADDWASCAVRFSLGWPTQTEDIQQGLAAWQTLYQRTRKTT